MRRRSRERLQTDERRQKLLELGRELFNARTYDEIGIGDIARAAGISKGLLYHYFPSKRHFYVETVRSAAARMMELTRPDESLAPIERLQFGLDAYLDYVDDNAVAYTNLMRSGVGADAEVSEIVEHTRQVMIDRILHGVGVTKPAAIVRTALRGWVGLVEAMSLDVLDHRDVGRSQLRSLIILALEATLAGAAQIDESAARSRRK